MICFDKLADAVHSLNPVVSPTVHVVGPYVGMEVGFCKNCYGLVRLRQPWLSKFPVVNDGYFLVHCCNVDCHNYYGMELSENEFSEADFVCWKEEYKIENTSFDNPSKRNVIEFNRKMKENELLLPQNHDNISVITK